MIQKLKKSSALLGLITTIAAALFTTGMVWMAYLDAQAYERMQTFLFDCGVDAIGSLVAAALYFGCMRQEGEGNKAFRSLNVFVSISFVVNLLLYYTMGVPEQRTATFIFTMLSKLFDLAMIYYFYLYVRRNLNFEGEAREVGGEGNPHPAGA